MPTGLMTINGSCKHHHAENGLLKQVNGNASNHLPFEKGGEQSEGAVGDLSNKISPNPSFSKRD